MLIMQSRQFSNLFLYHEHRNVLLNCPCDNIKNGEEFKTQIVLVYWHIFLFEPLIHLYPTLEPYGLDLNIVAVVGQWRGCAQFPTEVHNLQDKQWKQ